MKFACILVQESTGEGELVHWLVTREMPYGDAPSAPPPAALPERMAPLTGALLMMLGLALLMVLCLVAQQLYRKAKQRRRRGSEDAPKKLAELSSPRSHRSQPSPPIIIGRRVLQSPATVGVDTGLTDRALEEEEEIADFTAIALEAGELAVSPDHRQQQQQRREEEAVAAMEWPPAGASSSTTPTSSAPKTTMKIHKPSPVVLTADDSISAASHLQSSILAEDKEDEETKQKVVAEEAPPSRPMAASLAEAFTLDVAAIREEASRLMGSGGTPLGSSLAMSSAESSPEQVETSSRVAVSVASSDRPEGGSVAAPSWRQKKRRSNKSAGGGESSAPPSRRVVLDNTPARLIAMRTKKRREWDADARLAGANPLEC